MGVVVCDGLTALSVPYRSEQLYGSDSCNENDEDHQRGDVHHGRQRGEDGFKQRAQLGEPLHKAKQAPDPKQACNL